MQPSIREWNLGLCLGFCDGPYYRIREHNAQKSSDVRLKAQPRTHRPHRRSSFHFQSEISTVSLISQTRSLSHRAAFHFQPEFNTVSLHLTNTLAAPVTGSGGSRARNRECSAVRTGTTMYRIRVHVHLSYRYCCTTTCSRHSSTVLVVVHVLYLHQYMNNHREFREQYLHRVPVPGHEES